MVSLLDIAKVKQTAALRGQDVDITGVSSETIAAIFFEFPEIRMLLTQDAPDKEVFGSLIVKLPRAVALIIAAGTGHAGEEEHVQAASGLAVGEQYLLLEAIAKATFPQTVKSFLDGVAALVNQSGELGWGPGMKSPAPSSAASPPAEPKPTAGEAPLDNSAPGSN